MVLHTLLSLLLFHFADYSRFPSKSKGIILYTICNSDLYLQTSSEWPSLDLKFTHIVLQDHGLIIWLRLDAEIDFLTHRATSRLENVMIVFFQISIAVCICWHPSRTLSLLNRLWHWLNSQQKLSSLDWSSINLANICGHMTSLSPRYFESN